MNKLDLALRTATELSVSFFANIKGEMRCDVRKQTKRKSEAMAEVVFVVLSHKPPTNSLRFHHRFVLIKDFLSVFIQPQANVDFEPDKSTGLFYFKTIESLYFFPRPVFAFSISFLNLMIILPDR
jgi:hypothetical protein